MRHVSHSDGVRVDTVVGSAQQRGLEVHLLVFVDDAVLASR